MPDRSDHGEAASHATTLPSAPVDATLEQVLGYSLPDIFVAVENARRDFVSECLDSRGFTLTSEQYRNLGAPQPGSEDVARQAIEQIDSQSRAEPETRDEDPEFELAVTQCIADAESELPNPNSDILAQLDELLSDVDAIASADTRLIEAEIERQTCVALIGIDVTRDVAAISVLAERVDEVVRGVRMGTLSVADARTQLESLSAIEADIRACDDEFRSVEREVLIEAQATVRERYPGLIASVAEQARSALERYQEYLPD